MAGPWEKFASAAQAPAATAMPWEKYGGAPAEPAVDVNAIPGGGLAGNRNVGKAEENTDTLLGKIISPFDAGLSLASSVAAGAIAPVAGFVKSAVRGGDPEKNASDIAEAIVRRPATQTGARMVESAGQALAPLAAFPSAVLTDGVRAVGSGTQSLRTLAGANAGAMAAQEAAAAAAPGPTLRQLVRAPATMPGVGAAEVSPVTTRAQRAANLPVPIKLTSGQLTRNRQQVAFERETAKQKEGAPLAAAYEDQNASLMQNLDDAVDQSGAANVTQRAVGKSVVAALDAKQKAKTAEIRGLYDQARQAGEMQHPVDVSGLVDWIAKNKGKDKLAPIISTIESELKQNAKVEGGGMDNLTLNQRPTRTTMTLDASEDLRQAINKLAEPGTPNVVYGKDARALIDAAQEGKGGDLFKQARRAYENYANEFTNRDVIDKALRTKPGTKDRAVAYEDVFNHSIMNGSTDDVRHVFRVLTAHPKGADEAVVAAGNQAAADLRGAVVNHIKDEMQKNLNVDSTGARTGSTAKIDSIVRELDKDGKLEVIFGKTDAQKIRDLRDTAIDIYTSPTGTVNSSNTSSALMNRLDDIAGYAKGTPVLGKVVKYATDQIHSANTSRKVRKALNPNLKDLAGKEGN